MFAFTSLEFRRETGAWMPKADVSSETEPNTKCATKQKQ